MKPIFSRCTAWRCFGASLCTATSSNQYSPSYAPSIIPRMLSSELLPAPDGPMIDTNSPGLISRLIRRST